MRETRPSESPHPRQKPASPSGARVRKGQIGSLSYAQFKTRLLVTGFPVQGVQKNRRKVLREGRSASGGDTAVLLLVVLEHPPHLKCEVEEESRVGSRLWIPEDHNVAVARRAVYQPGTIHVLQTVHSAKRFLF